MMETTFIQNLQAFLTKFNFIPYIKLMHKSDETLAVQCVYSKPWTTVGACSFTALSWGSTASERLEFCDPAALRELSHLFRVAGIWLWRIMQCVAGNEPWGESQQGTTSPLTCLNPVNHETWLEFWLISTDPSESQELWVTLTTQSVITYKMGRDCLHEESRHILNRFRMMVAQGNDCFTINQGRHVRDRLACHSDALMSKVYFMYIMYVYQLGCHLYPIDIIFPHYMSKYM